MKTYKPKNGRGCGKMKLPKRTVGKNIGRNLHEVFDKLVARDGCACHWCGESLTIETATRDHRIPRSKNGSNALTNLFLSCHPCNKRRGNMSYEKFYELMGNEFAATMFA